MIVSKRKYNRQPNIITRSNDQMSLIEKRVLYLVINQMETGISVQKDLFKNLEFSIPLKELNDTNYGRIKKALTELQSRKILIVDDFAAKKFTSIIPFPYVSINKSVVTLKMLGDVVPYFVELKAGFTKYELEAVLSLTSVYSQKLYELCSRWKDKKMWVVPLDEIKMLLNAENYARYPDFRRSVLELAVEEISRKTDIKVSFTPLKESRKYVAIEFKILTNTAEAKEKHEEEMEAYYEMAPGEIAHYSRVLINNYTFSKPQIEKILESTELFYKFIELESKIANNVIKDVKNPTAYMAKSLFEY